MRAKQQQQQRFHRQSERFYYKHRYLKVSSWSCPSFIVHFKQIDLPGNRAHMRRVRVRLCVTAHSSALHESLTWRCALVSGTLATCQRGGTVQQASCQGVTKYSQRFKYSAPLAMCFDRPSPLCLSTDVAIREAQIKKEFEARNHMQEFYAAVRTTFYTYSSASARSQCVTLACGWQQMGEIRMRSKMWKKKQHKKHGNRQERVSSVFFDYADRAGGHYWTEYGLQLACIMLLYVNHCVWLPPTTGKTSSGW